MTQETAPMSNSKVALIIPDDDYLARAEQLKDDIRKKYKDIASEKTPKFDDAGQKIRAMRDDGWEYIVAAYMEMKLDEYFPGWSWRKAGDPVFLGAEWVVVQGELSIIDEKLIGLGIIPPYRHYYALNASRIQYKSGQPHTPENIVDIGNNVVSANTEAMKVAINRMTHIGHDVYGRRIYESLADVKKSMSSFNLLNTYISNLVKNKVTSWSKVFQLLEVDSIAEVDDYDVAYLKVKEKLGSRG